MRTYLSRINLSHVNSNSENKVPCFNNIIHVTGTKGKGSTICMCESVVRNKYYKNTGMFTSPHLVTVRERIRLNGLPVSEQEFADSYWKVHGLLFESYKIEDADDDSDRLPCFPTYFRFVTILGLYIFANHTFPDTSKGVEVILLEVGLGGRYDATNLFESSLCAGVTILDLDHVRVLGDTLPKIAWEKGGIFKKGSSCYTVEQSDSSEAQDVLAKCAAEVGEKMNILSDEDNLVSEDVVLGLKGDFQRRNAALAVALSRAAASGGSWITGSPSIDDSGGTRALDDLEVKALGSCSWPGRCQIVEYIPPLSRTGDRSGEQKEGKGMTFFLDGAHTEVSMQAYVNWLKSGSLEVKSSSSKSAASKQKKYLIFNCSHERNPVALLKVLIDGLGRDFFDGVFFCASNTERPSLIPKPKAAELLEGKGVEEDSGYNEEFWQDTLRILWWSMVKKENNYDSDNGYNILSMGSFGEAMDYIQGKGEEAFILCSGSLYIVGSVLEEITKRVEG